MSKEAIPASGESEQSKPEVAHEEPDPPATTKGPAWLTVAARGAIPLGYGVVVAVFVALGIEGDVFTRLMRNNPGAVACAFILAVVAVVVPLVVFAVTGNDESKDARRRRGGADVLGAVLLVAATSIAVVSGSSSFGVREHPVVALVDTSSRGEGTATLTIRSSASSQKVYERLLLRIEAFPEGTSPQEAWTTCRDTGHPQPDGGADTDSVHLVYWGEVGPDGTGSATAQVSIEVSTSEYQYVCAHAVLSVQNGGTDPRYSSLLIDVRQLPSQKPATEEG